MSQSSSTLSLPLFLLLLLLLLLSLSSPSAAECSHLDSPMCKAVISSYEEGLVFGSAPFLEGLNEYLSSQLVNLTIVGPIIFPTCYEKAQKFLCGNFFPECRNGTKFQICKSVCDDFEDACSFLINSQGMNGTYPSCSTFPTTDCSLLPNVPSFDPAKIECPAPLIKNPHPEIPVQTCPGDGYCCVPCPAPTYFFKEGVMDRVSIYITVLNLFNFFFAVIVVGSYLAIPAKREFPFTMITAMGVSILIAYFYPWITVFVGEQELLCYDEVTASAWDYITPSCRAQSIIFIYGISTAVLWFSAFAFNVLFVMTTGRSVSRLGYVYHAICWTVPIIPVVILDTNHQLGTSVMPFCGIPSDDWANNTIFVPAACLMFPAFASNMYIFIKFFVIARRVKKSIVSIFAIQLRPLIFSTYCIFVFLLYWLYIRLFTKDLGWTEDWFFCLAMGYGQDACSEISAPNIKLGGVLFIYFAVSTFGVAGFGIFVLKKDMLESLFKILSGKDLSSFHTDYNRSSSNNRNTENKEEVQMTKARNSAEERDPKEPIQKQQEEAKGQEEKGPEELEEQEQEQEQEQEEEKKQGREEEDEHQSDQKMSTLASSDHLVMR